MHPTSGVHKLRFASCSVLLLLLTLALVASSLLVARYAVQASSWWLSLLAVTVCLLGLCTWIQLAASSAGRWRVILARQIALSRAQASARTLPLPLHGGGHAGHGPGVARGLYAGRAGARSNSMSMAHIAVIPLDRDLDAQVGYRVPGPPPPPPYALSDLPPSYCAATTPEDHVAPTPASPGAAPVAAPSPESTGPEPPPPYAVAIKRDLVVQEEGMEVVVPVPTENSGDYVNASGNANGRNASANRRPIMWY